MDTSRFISSCKETVDVGSLALQAANFPGVDMKYALEQIEGWQKARRKIPSWAAYDGIVFPPRRSMEQCSSEKTALYKRSVVDRLLPAVSAGQELSMVDLTGGFGVDFFFLSSLFRRAVYVERSDKLCRLAEENFKKLGMTGAKIVCGDAATYVSAMKPCLFANIDPDRRDAAGRRRYAIADCCPDVEKLNGQLLGKAVITMVKFSPMLDWRKAVHDLQGVAEVHIVSVGNECRELIVLLSEKLSACSPLKVFCVNDNQTVSFVAGTDEQLLSDIAPPLDPAMAGYLYEPNASVMKAGCFSLLCREYGVKKIEKNSHLFISPAYIAAFPGKRYKIMAVVGMNKKELKNNLSAFDRANVAVKNFPIPAEELRKRLKLKDGGDVFIFGTTDSSRRHVLIICGKAE